MTQRKNPLKTNVMGESNDKKGIAFVTFNPDNPEEAANALENSKALDSYQAVSHYSAHAGGARDKYQDISTNISVRNEFTRDDYDSFRPSEKTG